jgi:hypothetical protein
MQKTHAKLLDVVALLDDRPGTSLKAGQVGTIVDVAGDYTAGEEEIFEVEFCDEQGHKTEFAKLRRPEFLVLLLTHEVLPF